MSPQARRLHAALPQTQCTRCGYPDCAGYAEAMAAGAAAINQCPPGGAAGIARLAALTGAPVLALDPRNGREGPRAVAVIDENWCIGCTLCMEACPTDAILGSNKRMHTVIERWCTGCELCVPACPVDCIALENVTGEHTGWQAWSKAQADAALARYQARMARLAREREGQAAGRGMKADAEAADLPAPGQGAGAGDADRKRAVIEAAVAKARARRPGP